MINFLGGNIGIICVKPRVDNGHLYACWSRNWGGLANRCHCTSRTDTLSKSRGGISAVGGGPEVQSWARMQAPFATIRCS